MYTPHQVVTVYQERNYNGSDSNNMCEHGANKTPSTLTKQSNKAKLPFATFQYTISSMLQVLPAILNFCTHITAPPLNLLESFGSK